MSRFISVTGRSVAELAARTSEDGRLSRGRALFRKGAVSDLTISEGSVTASVRGSQGDDYAVGIGTSPAPPGVARQVAQAIAEGQTIDSLTDEGIDVCPRDIDLGFSCECADWDEPCKHVVAALLAFADRVDLDAGELLRWRAIDPNQPADDSGPTPSAPAAADATDTTDTADIAEEAARHRSREASTRPGSDPDPPFDEARERSERLSDLKALLGGTAMRPSRYRGRDEERERPKPISAELSSFLGVGHTVEAPVVSTIVSPPPLFAELQLGPLADLGHELAAALTAVAELLAAELHETELHEAELHEAELHGGERPVADDVAGEKEPDS